jgi:hypothetical protein
VTRHTRLAGARGSVSPFLFSEREGIVMSNKHESENQLAILNCIKNDSPESRADICRKTGLGEFLVKRVLATFKERGFADERVEKWITQNGEERLRYKYTLTDEGEKYRQYLEGNGGLF